MHLQLYRLYVAACWSIPTDFVGHRISTSNLSSSELQRPASVCSGILLFLAKCLHTRLMSSPPALPPPPVFSFFTKTHAAFSLALLTCQVASFPRSQVQQECNINSQVTTAAHPCPQLGQFRGLQQHHTLHFFRKGSGIWEGGSL